MRLSQYFYKSKKDVKDNLPLSLNRLLRGCFLTQEATGIVRFLPLGLKVLKKLINIIEEEMNKIALQIELPLLQSVDLWKKSGRYEAYGKETLRVKDRNNHEFIIPPTCEENVFDVFANIAQSYRDLPKSLYQITWKFRDEMRPRSGLLRGRLFMMKDSYSFAENEEDSHKDYINHYNAYIKIFNRLELEVYSIRADSGEIGGDLSHEFVIVTEEGDDKAFLTVTSQNVDSINEIKEFSGAFSEEYKEINKTYKEKTVMEIAHIFYYDVKYSKKMSAQFHNKDGKLMPYYGGCYGIGVTRLMGLLSMKEFWPISLSPFHMHIINIVNRENLAEKIYEFLKMKNLDVLYDDRNLSFGEKKADMKLIGIPIRVIVGEKIEFYNVSECKLFDNLEDLWEFINPIYATYKCH
jgi:prolyl-tRNA synthetase